MAAKTAAAPAAFPASGGALTVNIARDRGCGGRVRSVEVAVARRVRACDRRGNRERQVRRGFRLR